MTDVAIRVLDTVTRTAPLGVRFWDAATQRPVTDGIVVTAFSHGRPDRLLTLARNASGNHVLHTAPELARSAWGDGTASFWAALGERVGFTLEVRDGAGRFLPVRLEATLPHRGFFEPSCIASPPASPIEPIAIDTQVPAGFVPLFSAAGRAGIGTQAVIRAALRHGDETVPAAWAVLVAEVQGRVAGVGIADRRGDLAMLFPFPELERRPSATGSPVDSPPAVQQTGALPVLATDVTLRVFYSGTPDMARETAPDFCALMAQPERRLAASLSPVTELGSVRLVLGRELWLQSEGATQLYVD